MSDHWSDYWSQGRITSLPQDFAANYDGEVAQFWHSQFEQVPESGTVIDVCTGNGAIALLAAGWFRSEGLDVRVMAIDAATMDSTALISQFPDQAEAAGGIEFVGGMRIEDLSLDDASADLVTSQYGIEYCDWEAAARQVHRVVKPGGHFVMVCHNPDSEILTYMLQEQADYSLLEEHSFFSESRRYLDDKSSQAELIDAYVKIAKALETAMKSGGSALIGSVLGLIANACRMSEAHLQASREQLVHYIGQMEAGRDRLNDMLRVNSLLKESSDWPAVFSGAGLVLIEQGELRYRGKHHAGGWYRFEKPANG